MLYKLGKNIDVKFWLLIEKVTRNRTVFALRRHFLNEISNEPATCLSGKLSCNWLIMLVTMATPISSHVKDKNNIFTTHNEDMIFSSLEKSWYFISIYIIKVFFEYSSNNGK